MKNFLKNLLIGARESFTLAPPSRDYILPQRGDFARDAEALRGDARRVAGDMRRTLDNYSDPAYKR